jgi:hypothetical protein
MRIVYKSVGTRTRVIFGGLIGLARVSRGDKYDKLTGIAVAAIKATEPSRMDAQEAEIVKWEAWDQRTDHGLDLTDEQVGALIKYVRGYQKALSTTDVMGIVEYEGAFGPMYFSKAGLTYKKPSRPTLGELAENVGRQLAETWRKQGVKLE